MKVNTAVLRSSRGEETPREHRIQYHDRYVLAEVLSHGSNQSFHSEPHNSRSSSSAHADWSTVRKYLRTCNSTYPSVVLDQTRPSAGHPVRLSRLSCFDLKHEGYIPISTTITTTPPEQPLHAVQYKSCIKVFPLHGTAATPRMIMRCNWH